MTTPTEEEVAKYFDALVSYLEAQGTNSPTLFSEEFQEVTYAALLTSGLARERDQASFSNGKIIDTIHQIMAHERELRIRLRSRRGYYEDHSAAVIRDITFLKKAKAETLSIILGKTAVQNG